MKVIKLKSWLNRSWMVVMPLLFKISEYFFLERSRPYIENVLLCKFIKSELRSLRDNMKMYFSKGSWVHRLEVLIASVVVSLLLGCVWSDGHTKLLMTRDSSSTAILHEWLVNWTLDLQVHYGELRRKVNVYERVQLWKYRDKPVYSLVFQWIFIQ